MGIRYEGVWDYTYPGKCLIGYLLPVDAVGKRLANTYILEGSRQCGETCVYAGGLDTKIHMFPYSALCGNHFKQSKVIVSQ